MRGLAEEIPEAYKDVTQVVAAAEGAGLCRTVGRLVPLGVVKGLAGPGPAISVRQAVSRTSIVTLYDH